MTQQWEPAAQKAKRILGCLSSPVGSRAREGILPLCSVQTPPAVPHAALGSQHRESINLLEQVQRKAVKMLKGLKHLSYEVRLFRDRLELFSLWKRLQRDLRVTFKYLQGTTREVERDSVQGHVMIG